MAVIIHFNEQCVLKEARIRYGNRNQILVAMEELNELGAVLAKFGRYDSEETALAKTGEKVIDELADVYIVLEHVKSIYGISDEQIMKRSMQKVFRLHRWLDSPNGFEQTTRDRDVPEITLQITKTCGNCAVFYKPGLFEKGRCAACENQSNFIADN